MENTKKTTTQVQSEFTIHFEKTAKIKEQVPENDLRALCLHIFEALKIWDDPVKVLFPNGEEYYWGEKGTWLAQQFVAEGKLTEEEFLSQLKEHNQETLVNAKRSTEQLKELLSKWKEEIRIAEQSVQEAINGYQSTFEHYMQSRSVYEHLKQEAS